jgi:hypothetical protein
MMDGTRSPPSAKQNLIGGLLAVALGVYALVTARDYPMGSLLRMGPGFFPYILAGLVIVLGFALMATGLRPRREAAPVSVQWRAIAAIGLGIVLFAELLERAGLVPATLILVLVSSLGDPQWRPWRAGILAVAMAALVYVIFIVVLQIPVAAVSL